MSRIPETEARARRLYAILTGIILATLPCYCLGFAALTFAPPPQGRTTPTLPSTPTQFAAQSETLEATLSATPGPSPTRGSPTSTLRATPTQFVPPSFTPTVTASRTFTASPVTPSATAATSTGTVDQVSTAVAGTQTAAARQTATQASILTAIAGTQTAISQTQTAGAPTVTASQTASATFTASATATATETLTSGCQTATAESQLPETPVDYTDCP